MFTATRRRRKAPGGGGPSTLRWIAHRAALSIPLFIAVSFLSFGLVLLVPGDAASHLAGEFATEEQIQGVRAQLGLDEPLLVQYWDWATDALRGDLGDSLINGIPVTDLIWSRFGVTLSLAVISTLFAVMIGGTLGVLAAARRGSFIDRMLSMTASVGLAVPSFWLALLLLNAFATGWHWFPAIGYVGFGEDPVEWFRHMLLPSIALGAAAAAEIARQLRNSLVDVLSQDYIRSARSAGLGSRSVILKHALKNSSLTTLTVVGVQFSLLLGGSAVIESIFGLPGLGSLAVKAVRERDLPIIQGVVLMAAVVVLVVNLLVDLAYVLLDPRVRLES